MSNIKHECAVIVGSGSWGTALAMVAAECFRKVVILARDENVVAGINQEHVNKKYLPKACLQQNIVSTTDIKVCEEADIILFVVPTSATKDTAAKIKKLDISSNVPLISCSKGIDQATGNTMGELIGEIFPSNPVAILSGPNHAEEVSIGLVTCTLIGCQDEELSEQLQRCFATSYFRPYTSADPKGMELGGALKNVFAIAAGICRGMGLGDNALAALVTRGLAEMTRLGVALGGKPETFFGLSGVGDLMTTCYSPHSRNNQVGMALGKGKTLSQATDEMEMVAEGVPNAISIYKAARRAGVETPIIDAVYHILYHDVSAREALTELLARDAKPE